MGRLSTWTRGGSGRRSGGTEFSSQAALNSYMRQHPKADASKHSVAQSTKLDEGPWEKEKVAPAPYAGASKSATDATKAAKPGDPASHKAAADAAKAGGNESLAHFHAYKAEQHSAASSPAFAGKVKAASKAANEQSKTASTVAEHGEAANAHRAAASLAEQHGDQATKNEHYAKAAEHQQHVLKSRGRAGAEPRPQRGAPWE